MYEKKEELNPKSYESLYKSTTMTIRQHVEMFKRDSKQCNYNTVNHGTKYGLIMSQYQFDLLKYAYLNDENIGALTVQMEEVAETNAIQFVDKDKNINNPVFDTDFDARLHTKKENQSHVQYLNHK